MARFVIRLDDICPTMDHEKFARARASFEAAGVRPLIGVVPDNRDPDLVIDTPDPDFWKMVRALDAAGWGISQHGYQHRIHTGDRGLLGISPRSEFAGRPFEVQRDDLEQGKKIMADQGIAAQIFMAPFHSYDRATLAALKSLGFTTVTDGYGLHPWRDGGLTFVPQLFESSANIGVGVYTMCLHTNNMTTEEIDALGRFVKSNAARIIGFDQASDRVWPAALIWPLGKSLKLALTAKRKLRPN